MTRRTRLLKLAGGILLVLAVLFMLREVYAHRAALIGWRPGWGMVALLGALSALYGAALFLLAECWHRIIALYGAEPRRHTWPSYTTTLVARYLPGNVAHIFARAAWLRGGTLSNPDLARASAMELILVPCGAALALLCLAPFLPVAALSAQAGLPVMALLAGGVVVALAAGFALRKLLAHRLGGAWRPVAAPLLLATLFMGVLGAVFAVISGAVAGTGFALGMAAGLLGWLVGYATPGAPGGLGSREAVITLMLSSVAQPEAAILVALVFRLVTTLGELACFAVGALALPRKNDSSQTSAA